MKDAGNCLHTGIHILLSVILVISTACHDLVVHKATGDKMTLLGWYWCPWKDLFGLVCGAQERMNHGCYWEGPPSMCQVTSRPAGRPGKDENDVKLKFEWRKDVLGAETSFTPSRTRW